MEQIDILDVLSKLLIERDLFFLLVNGMRVATIGYVKSRNLIFGVT